MNTSKQNHKSLCRSLSLITKPHWKNASESTRRLCSSWTRINSQPCSMALNFPMLGPGFYKLCATLRPIFLWTSKIMWKICEPLQLNWRNSVKTLLCWAGSIFDYFGILFRAKSANSYQHGTPKTETEHDQRLNSKIFINSKFLHLSNLSLICKTFDFHSSSIATKNSNFLSLHLFFVSKLVLLGLYLAI